MPKQDITNLACQAAIAIDGARIGLPGDQRVRKALADALEEALPAGGTLVPSFDIPLAMHCSRLLTTATGDGPRDVDDLHRRLQVITELLRGDTSPPELLRFCTGLSRLLSGAAPVKDVSSARIVSMFFYPQGTYYCLDEKRNNIPPECGDWYIPVLKEKIARGILSGDVIINIPNVYSGTLAKLRELKGF